MFPGVIDVARASRQFLVRSIRYLVEPGVVSCPLWRPDPGAGAPSPVDAFGGVGRKP